MLNSIGLENPGIEALLAEKLPRLAELGVPLWVSVGGFAATDYAELCAALDDRDDVTTIELNLSCPNVDEAPESAAEIVAAARVETQKPLYAKLSPAASDVAEVALAVQAAGADGLSLVNTMRGLALDAHTLEPILGTETGGYSGPALKPIALAAVFRCYRATGLPIVGMGGILPAVTPSSSSLQEPARSRWGLFSLPTPTLPLGYEQSSRPSYRLGVWRNRRMRAALRITQRAICCPIRKYRD